METIFSLALSFVVTFFASFVFRGLSWNRFFAGFVFRGLSCIRCSLALSSVVFRGDVVRWLCLSWRRFSLALSFVVFRAYVVPWLCLS